MFIARIFLLIIMIINKKATFKKAKKRNISILRKL